MMQNSPDSVLKLLLDPEFDRVLIACHQNPDGDAVGSSFALAYALRKMGRQACAFCRDKIGSDFSYITEAEKELSPFEPAHFVTVDVASPALLGEVDFAEKIDLVMDHHLVNSVEAPVKLVLSDHASCGEIVLEIIRQLPVEFDAYLARTLFTAIATDTGCFRYSNTNENTFLSAAFLSRYAEKGDFYRIIKRLFETKTRKKLALESYAAENAHFEFGGRCAWLVITNEDMQTLGASFSELDGLINVIRQVEGVEASFVIKQKEEKIFKVSVRSEEGFDAAAFCSGFGGGGHRAAAGCTLEGSGEEVRDRILQALREHFA